MAVTSEFNVNVDCMDFTTRTNGDKILIKNVHLGAEAAKNLADLINSVDVLKVEIKAKED